MSSDPKEINKRMFAIQALSNTIRTGYYDESTLGSMEVHTSLYNMDFSDHALNEKKLDIIVERYGEIIFKKSGYKLEGGWGDVLEGVMTLGVGYAASRGTVSVPNTSSKSYINQAAKEGLETESSEQAKYLVETETFLPEEYYQKLDNNIAKAVAARDAEVSRIQSLSNNQQSKVATVVGGVDLRTGEVYVGVKSSSTYKGNATCAEDIVFRGLGGNENANILMTPAIRPRTNEIIPVCPRCQTKYPINQFQKGTIFDEY